MGVCRKGSARSTPSPSTSSIPRKRPLFATDGGNRVIVYRCLEGGLIAILQAYADEYDFHPSDIYRIASCGMDNTVKTWFMKGNWEGKILVWELQSSPPILLARLSHPQCKFPIKQTAMSFDGSTILSCCEDGSIWCWDAVP